MSHPYRGMATDGRATARHRYAAGGIIKAVKGLVGLPGPPSFRHPNTAKDLPPQTRMIDERARGYIDPRGIEDVPGQRPGHKLRSLQKLLEEAGDD